MRWNRLVNLGLGLGLLVAFIFVYFNPAYAQASSTPAQPDWRAFLGALASQAVDTLLNLVLTFGGGVIPAFLVGYVVDRIVKFVPFLAPFRELVKQWVLSRLEEMKRERAKTAALQAGQAMRDRLLTAQGEVSDRSRALVEENLKEARNSAAAAQLVSNRTAKDEREAVALLRSAVASLKAEGVNP